MKTKLLLLLFAVLFTTANLQAYNFKVDGIFYNITSSNTPYTLEVTSGAPSYTGVISIPSSVANNGITYLVTSIGGSAFSYSLGLTSVSIPTSVTTIGDNAFWHCSALTSVNIPNSVTSIGINAFMYCSGLTSVSISSSATSIGLRAFMYCTGLTSVTVPSSVTSIGDYAFAECAKLISVTIPNSVDSTGDYTFLGCTGLTTVTIGNSVTSIGNAAFSGCSKLISVTIPGSVTSIGNNAFYGCIGFTSVTIPSSVTTIGNSAFGYCTGLTSVTIVSNPNSVTTIGDNAFEECSKLTSVSIPPSVASIGGSAFYKCIALTSVTIPASVISMGDWAFFQCSGLTSINADSPVPINLSSSTFAFANINKTTCTVYVPTGSKSLYAAANVWKSFTNIMEHTVSVIVPIAKVVNGQFDNGTQNWNLSTYATGAAATMKIDTNSVVSGHNSCAVQISQTTGTDWHIQLWQGLPIYPGHKYTITFKAKATAARSIILALQESASPYTTYFNKTHNLTTEVQTFTDEITINTLDQAKLQFYFGSSTGSVWIDDITIVDTQLITGIHEPVAAKGNMSILQNYPNPFSSATTIKYKITEPGFMSLKVFDINGTEIANFANEKKPVGEYVIDWNTSGLGSGIYLCKLQFGKFSEVKKMVKVY